MAAGRKPGYLQHQSMQAQEVEILHLQERFIPVKTLCSVFLGFNCFKGKLLGSGLGKFCTVLSSSTVT